MQICEYLKTDKRHFIQFNMWKNCRNHCEFCFNRGYKLSTDNDKLEIIKFVQNKLEDRKILNYNEIGFIGGEFFDDQLNSYEVKNKFYKLFEQCKKLKDSGTLDKICVATSLVFDINAHLLDFIQYLKKLDLLNITLFCTSYDCKYRFHSENDLKTWQKNMKLLSKLVPNKVHTEMIVSGFFIDSVMSKKLDLLDFCNKYHTSIDFIEPTFIDYFDDMPATIKQLPDFFPRRQQFIDFVKEYALNKKIIDINRFLSIKLRSDTSYYQLENKSWTVLDDRWKNGIRRIDKHGKCKRIVSYSDSDTSMIDDLEILKMSSGI